MPGEHARLSPSAADRWFKCPGAPNAEQDLPETESPAASWGIAAHDLLEAALRQQQEPSEATAIKPGADAEMIAHVRSAWHLVQGMAHGGKLAVEIKTNAGQLFERSDLWGTADVVIGFASHLALLDFKYGTFPVEPDNNKQLLIYAAGAVHWAEQQPGRRIDSITLGIIQPRTPGPALKLWDIGRTELNRFIIDLGQAAAATDNPGAPRIG